jgi:hypothetical protein
MDKVWEPYESDWSTRNRKSSFVHDLVISFYDHHRSGKTATRRIGLIVTVGKIYSFHTCNHYQIPLKAGSYLKYFSGLIYVSLVHHLSLLYRFSLSLIL